MRKRAYRNESAQVSSHWPKAMRAAGSHRRTTGSQEISLPCNCFNRTAILRSARSQYGVRALRKSPISDTPAVIAIPVPARMHGATSTRTTDAARVARRQARCLARGIHSFHTQGASWRWPGGAKDAHPDPCEESFPSMGPSGNATASCPCAVHGHRGVHSRLARDCPVHGQHCPKDEMCQSGRVVTAPRHRTLPSYPTRSARSDRPYLLLTYFSRRICGGGRPAAFSSSAQASTMSGLPHR